MSTVFLLGCSGSSPDPSGSGETLPTGTSGGETLEGDGSGSSADGTTSGQDSNEGSDGSSQGDSSGTGGQDCVPSFVEVPDSLRAQLPVGLDWIGVAVGDSSLADEPTYADVAATEFNVIAPENSLKWGSIEATEGAPDFAAADRVIDFACESEQEVHGHALLWHDQLPSWVAELPAAQLQQAVDRRIDDVVERYAGRVTRWDVVSQVMDDSGVLRDTLFLQKLGPDYIASAFHRARAADPAAELGFVDFGLVPPGGKADGAFSLLEGMIADGVPVDYVGFQIHTTAAALVAGSLSEANIRESIQQFASLGIDVYITGLDVRVAGVDGDKGAIQREAYRNVVNACRAESGCKGILVWGVTDKYSWINEAFGPDEPLLFDESYTRKDAYQGVLDGFAGLPSQLCAQTPDNALFCDGAESTVTWLKSESGGSLGLSTDNSHGTHSLLALVTGAGPGRQALGTRLFDRVTSGTIFMRAFVKIPATTDLRGLTIFGLNESVLPYEGIAFGVSDNNVQLSVVPAAQYPTGNAFVRDVWTCIELEITVGVNGSATLYVNDAAAVSVSGVNTLPAGGYESANAGILWAQDDQNGTALVDDVAVAPSRIGCQ